MSVLWRLVAGSVDILREERFILGDLNAVRASDLVWMIENMERQLLFVG